MAVTTLTKVTPLQEFRLALSRPESKETLKAALSRTGIDPEKFIVVATAAVEKTPALLQANRQSLYTACKAAARDGLLPDGREAALVVYGKENPTVQYLPMVAGLLKKIRNSGELQSISPHVVRKGDNFRYWIDEHGEHLMHEPSIDDSPREITHAYCIARTKDGGVYIEVLTKGEVDQVRAGSRAKGGPWADWYSEMAKKTAIRRLAKRLPMSSDMEMVFKQDDLVAGPENLSPTPTAAAQDVEPPATRTAKPPRQSRVGKVVAATVVTAPAPEPVPVPEPQSEEPPFEEDIPV